VKIPSIVKFTLYRFVLMLGTIAAIVGLVFGVAGIIALSAYYFGNSLYGLIPIFLCVLLGASYFIAIDDVKEEESRNEKILNRLSRED